MADLTVVHSPKLGVQLTALQEAHRRSRNGGTNACKSTLQQVMRNKEMSPRGLLGSRWLEV